MWNREAIDLVNAHVRSHADLVVAHQDCKLSSLRRRIRRGSDSHIRCEDSSVVIAAAPERRPIGASGRESYQRPRPRKLTIKDREAVRSAATSGRSLRSLAGAF